MFPSILAITFCIYFNIDSALTQEHDALVVIDNSSSFPKVLLPYEAREENGKIIYPKEAQNGDKIEYLYLCPAQTKEVKQEILERMEETLVMAFTLEENPSTDLPTKCAKEVQPVLIVQTNPEEHKSRCPISDHHVIFNFGFNPPIDMPNQKSETTTLVLYDICYNTKGIEDENWKRWTSHRVASSLMLQGTGLPSQQINPPYDYSTEPYGPRKNTLSILSEAYKNQAPDTPFKMIPQMLVPEEDFAIKIWKKTTTHFVNTEPLWEKLKPLMKAINAGIRKAANAVNVKTFISKEHPGNNLDIYTIVHYVQLIELISEAEIFDEDPMGFNIWCKLILYESEKKGLMIYLHNVPKFPPKKFTSTSNDSEPSEPSEPVIRYASTECEKPVSCDFRKWSDDLAGQSDDLLEYAYCCPVNNEKVVELFDITLDTKLGLLDINDFINGGKI